MSPVTRETGGSFPHHHGSSVNRMLRNRKRSAGSKPSSRALPLGMGSDRFGLYELRLVRIEGRKGRFQANTALDDPTRSLTWIPAQPFPKMKARASRANASRKPLLDFRSRGDSLKIQSFSEWYPPAKRRSAFPLSYPLNRSHSLLRTGPTSDHPKSSSIERLRDFSL